ncbi:hypothetical protein CDAR_282951 [Caerostris darwini]|uniref:Uncharacterized protein n=1 Tax=Caerostris darwini TaxID=1538125 RepID=A0AAV4W905_9ARAC|nr:hypothetical protein CDAR_282951 [Caerostris darwini]
MLMRSVIGNPISLHKSALAGDRDLPADTSFLTRAHPAQENGLREIVPTPRVASKRLQHSLNGIVAKENELFTSCFSHLSFHVVPRNRPTARESKAIRIKSGGRANWFTSQGQMFSRDSPDALSFTSVTPLCEYRLLQPTGKNDGLFSTKSGVTIGGR